LKILASGFGTGYSPVAPGTAGSLLAYVILFFIPTKNLIYPVALIAFTLFAIYISGVAEKSWGTDSRKIVIDEMAGAGFAIAFIPKIEWVFIVNFLIFRLLDVVKPPPANFFNKRKGGADVVLDDVTAGIYTNLLTWWIVVLKERLV